MSFNKDATKARAALLDRDGWERRSRVVPAADLTAALTALRIPEDEAERIASETLGQLDALS